MVVKKEIHYLLSRVIEKYENETGNKIIRNSNRKNYEPVSILLSEFSKDLPYTAEKYGHDSYSPDESPVKGGYPSRKYDITCNQVKDAYFNQIVSNPRPFLMDACYIYLYGMGRKAFLKTPIDKDLHDILLGLNQTEEETVGVWTNKFNRMRSSTKWLTISTVLLLFTTLVFSYLWFVQMKRWSSIKSDFSILPYQPTHQEIDKMEGVWLCYTGSPQARPSDPDRFHKVVPNVIEIRYKNGYFLYTRYGASFNHKGYLQFESTNLVSIHTFVKNEDGKIESPRHSLLTINENDTLYNVISASWNFDVGEGKRIIGIREVYIKMGNKGELHEVINSLENATCKCKIVQWAKPDSSVQKFYLKNVLLDSLKDKRLLELINEKSILTRDPKDSLLIGNKNS